MPDDARGGRSIRDRSLQETTFTLGYRQKNDIFRVAKEAIRRISTVALIRIRNEGLERYLLVHDHNATLHGHASYWWSLVKCSGFSPDARSLMRYFEGRVQRELGDSGQMGEEYERAPGVWVQDLSKHELMMYATFFL